MISSGEKKKQKKTHFDFVAKDTREQQPSCLLPNSASRAPGKTLILVKFIAPQQSHINISMKIDLSPPEVLP